MQLFQEEGISNTKEEMGLQSLRNREEAWVFGIEVGGLGTPGVSAPGCGELSERGAVQQWGDMGGSGHLKEAFPDILSYPPPEQRLGKADGDTAQESPALKRCLRSPSVPGLQNMSFPLVEKAAPSAPAMESMAVQLSLSPHVCVTCWAASGQGETFTPLPTLGPIEASLEKVGGKSAALTERPLPGAGRHSRRHRWHGAEDPGPGFPLPLQDHLPGLSMPV